MPKDYYAVLGLDRDATNGEIKAVYREIVKECHPDVAGSDPEKTARFQEATEAYKTLIDPYQRKKHDAELPMKSYPLRRPTPERVWKEVTEVILLRSDRVGPFQRALQEAKPVALEEDKIIVGFSDVNFRSAAYLEVPADRRALLNALELVMGREIGFRCLQGESLEDWERVKKAEARVAARAKANEALLGEAKVQNLWEELGSRTNRAYNEMVRRQFPQNRAAFLFQALEWINETAGKARALKIPEEVMARDLAKAIERLANLVEVPPVVVALELARKGSS